MCLRIHYVFDVMKDICTLLVVASVSLHSYQDVKRLTSTIKQKRGQSNTYALRTFVPTNQNETPSSV